MKEAEEIKVEVIKMLEKLCSITNIEFEWNYKANTTDSLAIIECELLFNVMVPPKMHTVPQNGELTTCTVCNGTGETSFKPITISKETLDAVTVDKPDQLYKLKEEVKKYFTRTGIASFLTAKKLLSDWCNDNVSIEALEPVESKITIVFQSDNALLKIRHDGEPIDFTEKERKDVEHLLNEEYTNIEGLRRLLNEYTYYATNQMIKKEDHMLFSNWYDTK